jgi:hypothetical protein
MVALEQGAGIEKIGGRCGHNGLNGCGKVRDGLAAPRR